MDLKSGLEKLEKLQLVDALVRMAGQHPQVYTDCVALLTSDGGYTNDEAVQKALRKDLLHKIAETERAAEVDCCGKYHLMDDSSKVHDVLEVHNKWITEEPKRLSPEGRLQALGWMANYLQPNLEGKIYEFDGEKVLELLEEAAASGGQLSTTVLRKVEEVFSSDYPVWKKCQNYGLFEDAPNKVISGIAARKQRLSSNKDSSDEPTRKKQKQSCNEIITID